MKCGGCGCGDNDDLILRNMGRRYKSVTDHYPVAWNPCKSCSSCEEEGETKQLNPRRLQFLKEDCASCEKEECDNFITWEKIRRRLQKIGLAQTVSVGANPFLNACKIAKTRATKVQKY